MENSLPIEGVIVNTAETGPLSLTTSVNPRLRPKASTSSSAHSNVKTNSGIANAVFPTAFSVTPPIAVRCYFLNLFFLVT